MDSSFYWTVSLIAYLWGTLGHSGCLCFRKQGLGKLAFMGIIAGFCSHMVGLLLRTIASGHLPLTNLYESMAFFSWTIVLVYLIVDGRYKLKGLGIFASLLSSLTIGYALLLPSGYKEINLLMPALQSVWLEVHVITCFLGYAAFAIAFAGGITYLLKDLTWFGQRLPDEKLLDKLAYRIIAFGFFFLTLGIITGAIWANYAWGTYWDWDPKEVWALVTWLIYGLYLHSRLVSNWRGKRSAWLSIIGFIATIFTYLGVNLLMSGLHSYAK